MGVSEFVTCDDWMATNDLRNTSILGGISRSYLRKWLGVSKNMSNVSLYCDETPCPLPIHGLVTEFKKCKVGGLLTLQ